MSFPVGLACADCQGSAALERLYSHGMARVASVVAVACAVLVTACTAGHSPLVAAGAGTGSQSTAQVNGRSVQAGMSAGLPPAPGRGVRPWRFRREPAAAGSGSGVGVVGESPANRYALAEQGQVAGFLFGYPLMAGNPQPYSDKI